MKIALVNPRQSDSTVAPLGLLSNAACLLKAGFQVYVFDPFFNNTAYIERLKEIKPDLVGFGMLTSSYGMARRQIDLIRHALPKARLCAGGIHATALPEETLEDLGLDFVVTGEGEATIVEACRRLKDKEGLEGVKGIYYRGNNGAIVKNAPRELISDLDGLPHPAWELLPMEKYLIPPGYIRSYYARRTIVIYATRGCPYGCIYCASNIIFGRKLRYPSVEYVIEELRQLIRRYAVDSFYFFDDTFTVNRQWALDFCRKKREGGINLKWGCQSRADTISEDIVRAMGDAGCVQVDFGVESGSQKVLDAMNKGTTVAQIENAFALCRKFGIRPYASIMIGNVEEEEADVLQTAVLLKRIKPVYTSVCYLQPLPGSRLYDSAIKEGWFRDDKTYRFSDWDFRKGAQPIMTIKMDGRKQKELRAMLQNQAFMRNYMFFFSPRTLPFVFGLLATLLLRPAILFKSLRKIIRSGKADDLIDELLFEYRKRLMQTRVRHAYEL